MRFGTVIEAVRQLKKTLEEDYDSFTSDPGEFQQCCNVTDQDWESNYRFQRRVRLVWIHWGGGWSFGGAFWASWYFLYLIFFALFQYCTIQSISKGIKAISNNRKPKKTLQKIQYKPAWYSILKKCIILDFPILYISYHIINIQHFQFVLGRICCLFWVFLLIIVINNLLIYGIRQPCNLMHWNVRCYFTVHHNI